MCAGCVPVEGRGVKIPKLTGTMSVSLLQPRRKDIELRVVFRLLDVHYEVHKYISSKKNSRGS